MKTKFNKEEIQKAIEATKNRIQIRKDFILEDIGNAAAVESNERTIEQYKANIEQLELMLEAISKEEK